MSIPADVDPLVQAIMLDKAIAHHERAIEAMMKIRSAVMADAGLPEDMELPVPPEWEHKVPSVRTQMITLTEVVDAQEHTAGSPAERRRRRWWRR